MFEMIKQGIVNDEIVISDKNMILLCKNNAKKWYKNDNIMQRIRKNTDKKMQQMSHPKKKNKPNKSNP